MEENKNEKHDLTLWIITAIFGLLLMLAVFILSGKSAKATQFPSWTYNNETKTSNATYNDGKEYYLYKSSNTTEVSAYVNAYDNNGTLTMSVLVNWNYSTTHKIFAIYSNCTSTNPGRLYDGYTCTNVNVISTLGNSVSARTSVYVNIMADIDAITIYKPYTDSVGANYLQAVPKETYQDGYNAGVTQGHTDVQNDPNTYGLYSQAQYNAASTTNYNDGYTAGVTAVTTNPNNYNLYTATQYNDYGTNQYNAGVTYADGRVNTSSSSYSAGSQHGSLLALNEASSSTHGSGTTYTSYSTSNMNSEMNYSYNAGVNRILNNPNNYGLYTSTQYNDYGTSQYNTGISAVQNNPNNYGLYSSAQYSANYSAGQLNVLNTAASSTYGTGTTYSSYSSSDIEDEQRYAYAKGITDTTNTIANLDYVNGITTNVAFVELEITTSGDPFVYAKGNAGRAYQNGEVFVLNKLSEHGTETTYTSYSNENFGTEISYITSYWYHQGESSSVAATAGKIEVLNSFSHTLHGTQTTYTDFNSSAIQDEADSIYTAGISYGVVQTGETQSLTRFVPNIFGSLAAAIWPVMTYEVFGISILNILLVVLGIALAYIIIKMLL